MVALVRGVSRYAYGNAYLLEVAAAIAHHPKERFIQKDVVEATGIDKALVSKVFERLTKAGLIERCPEDGREHPYLRADTVWWELVSRHRMEFSGED